VTVFYSFQIISLSKTCWCFPSTDQSVEPNTNATDPKLIVILQNPFSAKPFIVGDVQSRNLQGFLSWLQSVGSAVSQTASDKLNSLFGGGQNSYAYPFPYRRWSYSSRNSKGAEAWTRLLASSETRSRIYGNISPLLQAFNEWCLVKTSHKSELTSKSCPSTRAPKIYKKTNIISNFLRTTTQNLKSCLIIRGCRYVARVI